MLVSKHLVCLCLSLFCRRLREQQSERGHVQRRLPLNRQCGLLLHVHQDDERPAQRLSRHDVARDGHQPPVLPRRFLRRGAGEGHSGRHPGGGEVTLGDVAPVGVFPAQVSDRGTASSETLMRHDDWLDLIHSFREFSFHFSLTSHKATLFTYIH